MVLDGGKSTILIGGGVLSFLTSGEGLFLACSSFAQASKASLNNESNVACLEGFKIVGVNGILK